MRRVVTGTTASGKSVFVNDSAVEPTFPRPRGIHHGLLQLLMTYESGMKPARCT